MKRHTSLYIFMSVFIGLLVVSFVIGSQPHAAAATLNAPVGLTETFTPSPTNTSAPTETNTPVPAATNTSLPIATDTPAPADTNTPVPADTNTPVPADTNTPVPADTNTSVPAPTNTLAPVETSTSIPPGMSVLTDTQVALAVVGLPNTGGGTSQSAAPQSATSSWLLVLSAVVIGSLGTLVFRLNRRAHRPTRR